jgi:hypothetical protein
MGLLAVCMLGASREAAAFLGDKDCQQITRFKNPLPNPPAAADCARLAGPHGDFFGGSADGWQPPADGSQRALPNADPARQDWHQLRVCFGTERSINAYLKDHPNGCRRLSALHDCDEHGKRKPGATGLCWTDDLNHRLLQCLVDGHLAGAPIWTMSMVTDINKLLRDPELKVVNWQGPQPPKVDPKGVWKTLVTAAEMCFVQAHKPAWGPRDVEAVERAQREGEHRAAAQEAMRREARGESDQKKK